MIIGMRSVLDEIQVTNCQHEAGAQSILRLHHSWLMSKTNKIILHTRHYFKGLVTVNVTMELITVVKRTQICMVRNGPVNREDEPVGLFTNLNFKQVVGCQVFWPLKIWYFVWYVLKTKDNECCRLR